MQTLSTITKEDVINEAFNIVNRSSFTELNARNLAKELGISTKPIYRMYKGMDEIKEDLDKKIKDFYDCYLNQNLDNENPLLSLMTFYVTFALEYKNLFIYLFLSSNLKWKSVNNVLDEKWNQAMVINLVNKHGKTFDEAKKIFLSTWLYANGLATLVATNDIIMDKKEIEESLKEIIIQN